MQYVTRLLTVGLLFLQACKSSSSPAVTPSLEDGRLDETSGIAASRTHTGLYYVHNDSGDSSRFFAIDTQGRLKAVFNYTGETALLPLGVKDCEDIAVGPGPLPGAAFVYVGDIGDNKAVRKYITIYRVQEPALPAATGGTATVNAEPLYLKYPDGPRDAETLLADPIDQLLYIVSKREDTVGVYSTPLLYHAGDTLVLTRQASVYFPGSGEPKWITAGDISADGRQVLLKSYSKVYYWKRAANEPIWQTLQRSPTLLPYTQEPQGEAIGFTADGTGYYTVSEGSHALLYYYKVP